jgi:REP element-mobilizing transposase RayT
MKENGNDVLGNVIMPDHVHLLLHHINTKQSLNTVIIFQGNRINPGISCCNNFLF